MKKFAILLGFLVVTVFVSDMAFGGSWNKLRTRNGSKNGGEYLDVGSGQYLECDDDDGDAGAKTIVYTLSTTSGAPDFKAYRCQITNNFFDSKDPWIDESSRLKPCLGDKCDNNRSSIAFPGYEWSICSPQGRGIKLFGNSIATEGGTSEVYGCYFLTNGNQEEQSCIKSGNGAYWDDGRCKCRGANSKFDDTQKKCVCEDPVNQVMKANGNCEIQQNINIDNTVQNPGNGSGSGSGNGGGNGGGGSGSGRVGKCHPSVCVSDICKACCAKPASETVWDRTGQACQCVNGGTFVKENGQWVCKIKSSTTIVSTYTCDTTLMGKLAGWKTQCAKHSDVLTLISELETYCSGKPTESVFLRLYDDVQNNVATCDKTPETPNPVNPDDEMRKVSAKITKSAGVLGSMSEGFKVSVWKDKDGGFNTARLASDSIAGVVLGTAGGLITSNVVKKNQVKSGFEDIQCTVGGQVVADWGDEFRVGIQ